MNRNGSGVVGWAVAGVVVVVLGVGAWYLHQHQAPTRKPLPHPAASVASTPAPAPVEQHPISQAPAAPAAASSAPLPALDASDTAVAKSLQALVPDSPLGSLLVSEAIIPRIVAAVNALPEREVEPNVMPVHPPGGSFRVTRNAGTGVTVVDAANTDRYARYMGIVDTLDPHAAAVWYVRYYPLFEKAYRQLGYPQGHFNDRLVQVIDQLLATPDVSAPVALKPYKAQYAFVDPRLEALGAGQKMMVRSGPANEARLKEWLRRFRAQVTSGAVPPGR